MRCVRLALLPVLLIASAGAAHALTIDLVLDVQQSGGQVTYTIGMQDTLGQPQPINGYTLGYDFDPAVLSFGSVTQLVSFGGSTPGFSGPFDCVVDQRCTAGNQPGVDSGPIGDLFAVTFTVTGTLADGAFVAGILQPLFDGITQGTGQSPFEFGVTVVPEPTSAALLGLGLLVLARLRRQAPQPAVRR